MEKRSQASALYDERQGAAAGGGRFFGDDDDDDDGDDGAVGRGAEQARKAVSHTDLVS